MLLLAARHAGFHLTQGSKQFEKLRKPDELAAEAEAALAAEKAAADALVAEAAAKKAERDQRYAARKARNR